MRVAAPSRRGSTSPPFLQPSHPEALLEMSGPALPHATTPNKLFEPRPTANSLLPKHHGSPGPQQTPILQGPGARSIPRAPSSIMTERSPG